MEKHTFDEAFEKSGEYFNGDELAASVWINKYAMKDSYNIVLKFLLENKMLSKNCVLVLEYSDSINVDTELFARAKEYKYGKSNIMI